MSLKWWTKPHPVTGVCERQWRWHEPTYCKYCGHRLTESHPNCGVRAQEER